ncbi:unnamed protein product [Brassica oleracea var. botrytis]|uniref:(rape) hypothetical protein n=1 Tax=Brassica napus TaxID=3708 RepID=A0A816JNQ3_BRANA|nr:unnamed protein product [Brassica napus]
MRVLNKLRLRVLFDFIFFLNITCMQLVSVSLEC